MLWTCGWGLVLRSAMWRQINAPQVCEKNGDGMPRFQAAVRLFSTTNRRFHCKYHRRSDPVEFLDQLSAQKDSGGRDSTSKDCEEVSSSTHKYHPCSSRSKQRRVGLREKTGACS